MTLAEELADKYEQDYWTVAPRYRTGERLQQCIANAVLEAIERCAQECQCNVCATRVRALKEQP